MRITLLAATLAAARTRPTALRAALRRRGGDVVETASASCKLSPGRAEELASLNEREHAAECVKVEGEAWSGDLEPDTDIPQTDKFAIPDWHLPDLDAELRNNGDVEIHVTRTPLFSQEECEHVIAMADEHANNAGGWGKIPAGRCVSRRPVVWRRLHAIDAISLLISSLVERPRRAAQVRRPRWLGQGHCRCQRVVRRHVTDEAVPLLEGVVSERCRRRFFTEGPIGLPV